MLTIKNISISFEKFQVLDNVNFTVGRGEALGLIGPNGSGKTTIFNIITGFLKPDRGEILYEGKAITGLKPENICRLGIARTFQITRVFDELSVLENVMLGRLFGKNRHLSKSDAAKQSDELLWFVRLAEKKGMRASDLTLTQQRRLELAMALATEPSLLLLDEVAAGLSPKAAELALDLMNSLKSRGLTLIVVDHVLRPLMTMADRVIVLADGLKITEGKPSEIAQDERVIEAYLGEKFVF